jgi:hypothetical protein
VNKCREKAERNVVEPQCFASSKIGWFFSSNVIFTQVENVSDCWNLSTSRLLV